MSTFDGLGRALRWLRDERGRRQFQVAEAAGITKPMLSAYETGRQKPSLDSLEKILEALDSNLYELYDALQLVNGRPVAMRGARDAGTRRDGRASPAGLGAADLHVLLGADRPLPRWQAETLGEMLQGFHGLIRHLHEALSRLEERGPDGPGGEVEPE